MQNITQLLDGAIWFAWTLAALLGYASDYTRFILVKHKFLEENT